MGNSYLSFAESDARVAHSAHMALDKAGVGVWRFNAEPGPDGQLHDDIKACLRAASSVVLLYTDAAAASEQVAQEYAFARAHQKTILVVRDPGAPVDPDRFPGLHHLLHVGDGLRDQQVWDRLGFHAERALREHCPVIAFMNAKGGVGKTTLAANVAGALNRRDETLRVLLVDLDPQFNLTQIFQSPSLLNEFHQADLSIISLFEESQIHGKTSSPADTLRVSSAPSTTACDLRELVRDAVKIIDQTTYQLNVIYGQSEIIKYSISTNTVGLKNRRDQFGRSIAQLRAWFDVIIVDTNPGISFLAQCARDVSDHVVAPILPNEFSLRGLKLLHDIDRFLAPPPIAPTRSILINSWPATPRASEEAFVAALARGDYDDMVGANVADQLLATRIEESPHYRLQAVGDVRAPLNRLIAYRQDAAAGLEAAQEVLFSAAAEAWERATARARIV